MTRQVFSLEWFDEPAALMRNYQLTFFPDVNHIEILDLKSNKNFLKKQPTSINLEDFYLGAIVNINSRQMKVVDQVDVFTYKAFEKAKQKSIFCVQGEEVPLVGDVLTQVNKSGVRTTRFKMGLLSFQGVDALRGQGASGVDASTNTAIVEVVGEDSMAKVRDALGGHGWCMTDKRQWKNIESKVFEGIQSQASNENASLILVKPHAIAEGHFGEILKTLFANFDVTGCQMFNINRAQAQEFYEVQKGVVAEFSHMVEQASSAPIVAIAISSGDNTVENARKLCGPYDPEVAKQLRDNTLRAKFGHNKVKNAVHCTDLAEDGALEVDYFFKILQGK